MSTNCKIDRASAFDCSSITQPGIKDYFWLINKDDLDNGSITIDTGVTEEITAITLDTGTYAYKFETSKGSAQLIPTSPLRSITSIDGFDHTIDFRSLDVSQLQAENIEKMRFNKVVAIVPLASGKFLLYGRNVGMRISDFQYNPGDADVGGTMQVVVKTPDNDPPEISIPHVIASSFDPSTLESS